MDFLMPLFMILLGVVAVTIYSLVVALKQAVGRLADMNERLIVLVGTKEGGAEVGRALVASAKQPKREIPGIASKPKKEPVESKKGITVTLGQNL